MILKSLTPYLLITTLLTYSVITTSLISNTYVLIATVAPAVLTSYFLSRGYFSLVGKGLLTFLTLYLITSLATQYLIIHELELSSLVVNSLRIVGVTYVATTCLSKLPKYLVIKGKEPTSLTTQLAIASKALTYVMKTAPELIYTIRTNYGLRKGLRAKVSTYIAVAKAATLNTLLRTIQQYEALITQLRIKE